jgi:hypothetical protein
MVGLFRKPHSSDYVGVLVQIDEWQLSLTRNNPNSVTVSYIGLDAYNSITRYSYEGNLIWHTSRLTADQQKTI